MGFGFNWFPGFFFIGERGDEFGGSSLDDAPGVAMEYKVHVEAGKEDCYWQYVHPGATLFVSAQVLKGEEISNFSYIYFRLLSNCAIFF